MKAIGIHVAPFKLTEVLDCTIRKDVNNHMAVSLSGYSTDNEVLQKIGPDTEISIEIEDEDRVRHCIFRGVLSSLTREEEGGLTKLEIKAKSKTALLDEISYDRFFYNEDQTYKDIVNYIVSSNKRTSVIHGDKSKELCGLTAQYQETDWEFLKRIASRIGEVVVPDCTNSNTCFYFGFPDKRDMDLDIASYGFRNLNGIPEYIVESREILDLCTPVVFRGHKLYVYGIESDLTGNELINKYFLRTKQGFYQKPQINEKIIGASFLGKVTEIRHEVIRIDCKCGCNINGKKTVWFPYATMYSSPGGTGWYCMPEKGDRVRLYFPDYDESHAYTISAFHMECQGDLRKNPEEKSLRTKYGKEIRFTPDKILITNNNGMSIILDDEKGIFIKSDKHVQISASEGIDIQSGGEASIVAKGGIIFKENNNSLVIEDGIRHTGLTIEYQ